MKTQLAQRDGPEPCCNLRKGSQARRKAAWGLDGLFVLRTGFQGFQVRCPGYPQTHFVAEDGFELLSALPSLYLLNAGITGMSPLSDSVWVFETESSYPVQDGLELETP